MWVTAYTDASFKEREGGAWAVYLKSNEGLIKQASFCPVEVIDPKHAEMFAIAKAVAIAHKAWGESIEGILINSDSLNCVKSFWGESGINKRSASLQKRINTFLSKHNIKIRTKHIKAHTGNNDIRSWLNEWCDKQAKTARLIKNYK